MELCPTYTEYQASQEQRRMERKIRALKREENALRDCGESIKVDAIVGKIKAATGEYRDFSDAVGLRAKTERLRVVADLKNTNAYATMRLDKHESSTISAPIE